VPITAPNIEPTVRHMMAHARRVFATHLWGRLAVSVLAISLIAGAALALWSSQASAKRGVENRFGARASLAASFVSTYVKQLTDREQLVATTTLGGSDPAAAFTSDVRAFGFQAAVLLDSNGRALALMPASAELLGQPLAAKYPYLAKALNGDVPISSVVTSTDQRAPLVAFAVPFETPTGRRVFSGEYTVDETRLSAFLSATTTLEGAFLYLTDGSNTVLASNGPLPQSAQTLSQRNPALGAAAAIKPDGEYKLGSVAYTFVKVAVPASSWSLLVSAPDSGVYVSLNGSNHWLPWLILAGLSVLIVFAFWLAIRLLASRRRLADLNGKLESLARTDGLTGLSNRRHLTEQLEGLMANAKRHDFNLCVLMIDIDHFKRLNDNFGHQVGDLALRHVADRLTASLREGDLLGRWGGEEFLAVLPYTGLEEGLVVADRLCHLVAGTPIAIGDTDEVVAIQTSVGVAQDGHDDLDSLVHRADLGLYEAKAAGRNTFRAASTTSAGEIPAAKESANSAAV
jgi:diguanylate cyclase (GGDEF)-like protein